MSQGVRKFATPSNRPDPGTSCEVHFYQDCEKSHLPGLSGRQPRHNPVGDRISGHALWLTNQRREDKDWALFGEANWDITPTLTLTGGLRFYRFDNILYGFAGFGPEPNPVDFPRPARVDA